MKKNYLIIGGSSGIGFETAKLLSKENNVIVVSSNQDKLISAFEKLQVQKSNHFFVCDVENPRNIEKLFSELIDQNIVLNGMVYTAGIAPLSLLKDITIDEMETVYRINFFSFVEAVKHFANEKNSSLHSRIVGVSSITAHGSGFRQPLYGSSKAAMISAVKLMAKELLLRDIHINCISPGVTESAMLDDLRQRSTDLDEKIKLSQPLGICTPESIAREIIYLLQSGSDFRTGTEIMIDAGASLK